MASTGDGGGVDTSLKFGTSGLRGLARDLVGGASARYTRAFLAEHGGDAGAPVLVGRDLRDSSPAIAQEVAAAIAATGREPRDCGVLPTPALALEAMRLGCAAVMVTGSHIPADRNGLKFYTARGEIEKADEAGIVTRLPLGADVLAEAKPRPWPEALLRYRRRYAPLVEGRALAALRVGVYQHSSVARDLLVEVLGEAGAEIVPLGRSEVFVPIDTEALGEGIRAQAQHWAQEHRLDAIVSADGDADRPLVADETGAFLRGDVLGLLSARFLGAKTVATPVTTTSAAELCGWFGSVLRTRVGSPYVIAAMRLAGVGTVVGFEANGGVLLGEGGEVGGAALAALPTRDALLPILVALHLANGAGGRLSQVVAELPARFGASGRLADVEPGASAAFLARLADPAFAADFLAGAGIVSARSDIDGPRFTLAGGETIHYRASGNAPELRCYTEAATPARAEALLAWGLDAAARALR